MLIAFLNAYFAFILVFSVIACYLLIRYKLPPLSIIILTVATVFMLPAVLGYVYTVYFNALPEVVVPDLRGYTYEPALDRLRELRLSGKLAGSISDGNYQEGQIASQRPEAGRTVKIGRPVSLLISAGQHKASVPSLLGRSLEQASAVLSAQGLVLGAVEKTWVKEMDPGIILNQTPLPDEKIAAGQAVEVTISATEESVRREAPGEKRETENEDKGGFRFPWWQ